MNRFKTALEVQDACNPRALSRLLVTMTDQVVAEGGDTKAICTDPACQLLVYQISFLFKMENFSWGGYNEAMRICEEKSA